MILLLEIIAYLQGSKYIHSLVWVFLLCFVFVFVFFGGGVEGWCWVFVCFCSVGFVWFWFSWVFFGYSCIETKYLSLWKEYNRQICTKEKNLKLSFVLIHKKDGNKMATI